MDQITLHSALTALLMTIIAGMGTGIGALMALHPAARKARFIAGALGFSAGVMLYVSFLELMPEAIADLTSSGSGHRRANLYAVTAFFSGILLIALIDFLVPEKDNPHEFDHIEATHPRRSAKSGIMLAAAIAIHNFPEGMATFVASLDDGMGVAVPIVIAILLHNIPEGIAVSVPVFNATGSHRKALIWSIASGLAEPLGAVVGMLFLLPLWSPVLNAMLLAGVAGVMVYISVDELLPGAERYGHHHVTIACVIAGMLVMAVSLL